LSFVAIDTSPTQVNSELSGVELYRYKHALRQPYLRDCEFSSPCTAWICTGIFVSDYVCTLVNLFIGDSH